MTSTVNGARALGCVVLFASGCAGSAPRETPARALEIEGDPELFAVGVASTQYSEVRLTISPDGRTALWFSRDRPGGPGGYDIWISRHSAWGWGPAEPVPFNSSGRDFDPAFSSDGRFVFFCSDRPGSLGGDDIYQVSVTSSGFGEAVNLGPSVNGAGNEFAPMLSPDRTRLLFSSDRPGGKGGHDLFTVRRSGDGFDPATRLAGDLNTAANEFDATFLSDGATIVFARAMDFRTDRVDLFHASPVDGRYDVGSVLPTAVNNQNDTYGPMLDWSDPNRLTFSGQRREEGGTDLYLVRYRLVPRAGS
jgi:TolB protein